MIESGDRRQQSQEALATAAAEALAAERALRSGIQPGHPDWAPRDEAAYKERFDRWRDASREVIAALDRLSDELRALSWHREREEDRQRP